MTKFDGDVDRISHNSDAFSIMNAPTNLGGCSSRTQRHDFPVFDHSGCGNTNSTLFGSLHLLLRNKRWESTERLVQHWLDLNSAAMSSTQKPCSVKITEFSPNGCGRRLETLSELLDRYLSIL
jgi:hypothetical protein